MIAAVDRLTELGRVEHSTIAGIAAVYLPEYYEAETAIAARIRAMAQHPPAPLPDAERVLQGIEAIEGITYAERQRDAIRMAAERRIMILTGGPGTGKTTVLSGILTLFSKLGRKTLLAAPTGRAAKRLSELTGRDAATVHRLLEAQVSPENGEMFFARNEDEPLECDAVIVDEMSMVDVLLMHSLLEALPQEACLVLVGDPDQLPSVGAGNLFSDLIRSGIVPSVCLTEIFRQARQSLIVMNAHAVNRGELPVLTAKDRDCFFLRRRAPAQLVQTVCELCARRLPQNMHIPAGEIQVISPTRKGETGDGQSEPRPAGGAEPAAARQARKAQRRLVLPRGRPRHADPQSLRSAVEARQRLVRHGRVQRRHRHNRLHRPEGGPDPRPL